MLQQLRHIGLNFISSNFRKMLCLSITYFFHKTDLYNFQMLNLVNHLGSCNGQFRNEIKEKLKEPRQLLSIFPHANVLTCLLLRPFLAVQSDIFEIHVRRRQRQSAYFCPAATIKVVQLVTRHFR